jgi:hypothetical protein
MTAATRRAGQSRTVNAPFQHTKLGSVRAVIAWVAAGHG